jgi:hypothetical protein
VFNAYNIKPHPTLSFVRRGGKLKFMFGLKNFAEKIIGKKEVKEKELTKAEEKQIKEGGEAVNELENGMDLEKKAEELQKTDKDLRTDFGKPEDKRE